MITKALILARLAYLSYRTGAYIEDIQALYGGSTTARLADSEGRRYSCIFEGSKLVYFSGSRCFTRLLTNGGN